MLRCGSIDRRGRRDGDAHRRPLRIVVLGSRDSGKATIVSILLGRNAYRTYSEHRRGDEEEERRVVESRHQAYHELHVHHHCRERNGSEDEEDVTASASSHEEITHDTRYDRVVLNWFKARFRSEKRVEEEAAAATAVVVTGEDKRRCSGECTRALVLYELYYDDSIHTTDDDDRRTTRYAKSADVIVIAYDPRDEKSVCCALRLLGAIGRTAPAATATTRCRNLGSNSDHCSTRSIVLIECDTDSVAATNPNAFRSLRNYYDAVEIVREQQDDSGDNAVVIDDDNDHRNNKQRRLFARLNCRHGDDDGGGRGDDDERKRRRVLLERVITRAIAPIVRIRSSVAAATRSEHTASWIPAASTPTAESSAFRDRETDDDDGCRLENAINELCYDDDDD